MITEYNTLIPFNIDGTNANTGANNGFIRLLEISLGRVLQWIICLYHMIELPTRHLFWHLDGGTSGPVCIFNLNSNSLNTVAY